MGSPLDEYIQGYIRHDRGLYIDYGHKGVDVTSPNLPGGGAKGDGLTDDTEAFQAALNELARRNVYGGTLIIPMGHYLISDELVATFSRGMVAGAGRWVTIIEQTDPTKGIFSFTNAQSLTFRDFMALNGTNAISLQTDNVDTSVINVEGVYFKDQTAITIYAAIGSNSTELNIERCTLWGSATLVDTACDFTNVVRCWVYPDGPGNVFINRVGLLTLRDNVGVPLNSDTDSCWVENYYSVYAVNNRFGSEDATGRCLLEHRAVGESNLHSVTFRDNHAPVIEYAYKFFTLPHQICIENNRDQGLLAANKGFWFADGIDPVNMLAGEVRIQDREALPFYLDGTGSDDLPQALEAKAHSAQLPQVRTQIRNADIVTSIMAGAVPQSATTNVTRSDVSTYEFLGAATTSKLTATADNATWVGSLNDTTSNHGVYPNIYTWVFDCFVVTTVPIACILYFNGVYHQCRLVNGLNIVNVTGQHEATANNNGWGLIFRHMISGSTINFGRIRQFLGHQFVTTVNTIFHDLDATAHVSDAFVTYHKGDRLEYADPASAGFLGEVITTSGANGSEAWKTFGLIS